MSTTEDSIAPSLPTTTPTVPFPFSLVTDLLTRLLFSSFHDDMTFNSDMFLSRSTTTVPLYPSMSIANLDLDFPVLAPVYARFETNFHAGRTMVFNRSYYGIGFVSVVLYLLFIYFGTKIMKNRKPFDLQKPLKYWNLCLAIFSLVGTLRVVPHVVYVLKRFGFVTTLCSPPVYFYGHGAAGLWILLFTYSKYVELIDTAFIILRKKELGFLHWYHHSTVLLYTWDAYCVEQPCGIYFVAMNYAVHTVMYFYFFVSAVLKRRLSWGIFVTVAQISQMFVGVAVTIVSLYYVNSYPQQTTWTREQVVQPLKHGVYISKGNLIGGMLMYSTYFYLFAQFFLQRYLVVSLSPTQTTSERTKLCSSSTSLLSTTTTTSKQIDSSDVDASSTEGGSEHSEPENVRGKQTTTTTTTDNIIISPQVLPTTRASAKKISVDRSVGTFGDTAAAQQQQQHMRKRQTSAR
eukprot:GHVS01022531.1.p1 GENE.GHVS01022531.1~~GHVS01022531.1.p1  ORF type:complete len:460 (-),score=71.69 GHVS01022531.1:60-1439(-)